jgi:alpha-1,4-digalacturonate transport system substrate-binding protein
MARTGCAVVTGLALIAALTGCGDDQARGPISPEELRGTEIDYLYFTDGPEEQVTRDLITRFESETGTKVNLTLVPVDQIGTTIEERTKAGHPPHVARVLTVIPHRAQVIDLRPYLRDPTFTESFLPELRPATTDRDGALLGVASDLTVNGPLINVDMFRRAGVDVPTGDTRWTWDELVAAATRVRQATGAEHAVALDRTGHRLSGLINQWGTTWFDPQGKPALDVGTATTAIQSLADLHRNETMPSKLWLGQDPTYQDALSMFLAQDVPVLFTGNWVISKLAGVARFRWQAVPNPHIQRSAAFPGGKYMIAFKKSGNPAAAAAFIEWMNSHDHQLEYVSRSFFLPTRKVLLAKGTRYPQRHEDMAVFNRATEDIGADEFATNASSLFFPLSRSIETEFASVLRGERTAASAADRLRQESERIFREKSG